MERRRLEEEARIAKEGTESAEFDTQEHNVKAVRREVT